MADFDQKKKSYFKFQAPKPENKDIVFGVQSVLETIRSGKEIEKILVQRELGNIELLEFARLKNIPVSKVPKEKLDRVTRKNHQGVVAYLSPKEYVEFEPLVDQFVQNNENACFLFLDRLTDVRNFGAIARTAECMGVNAIVIPGKGSVQVTADAIKTSAGALNRIPVCKVGNLKDSIFYLQQSGFRIIACTEKSSVPLYEVNLRGQIGIVMGSEEDGITNDILKMADIKAKIPMSGKISSLNVGVATGMILYEKIRQELY